MFIQVIKSKVKDAKALRTQVDKWMKDVAPGAKGWLGATQGVADEGTSIAVVRFESEDAGKANSDRPEQGAWWEETSKLFEGDVQFFNCPRVVEMMSGGSDDAGFVQVMVYKPTDVEKVLEFAQMFDDMSDQRPDFMGATTAVATDGTVIDTNYFRSEKEAREGESKPMPQEMQDAMKEFGELVPAGIEYIDLRDPWLFSP